MNSTDWLTFGLLVFAGAQVTIAGLAERWRRRADREAIERAEDIAHATIRAEWYRLHALVVRWREGSLGAGFIPEDLDPDEVRPSDPLLLARMAGQLGTMPAYFTAHALTLLADARVVALDLRRGTQLGPTGGVVAVNRPDAAKRLLWISQEAVDCLEDAMGQSPRAFAGRDPRLYIPTHSRFADVLREKFGTRPRPPQSGWALDAFDRDALP